MPDISWSCPVEDHCGDGVEVDAGTATCLAPGCGRTSADPVPRGFCVCEEYVCTGRCCGFGQCTCSAGAVRDQAVGA